MTSFDEIETQREFSEALEIEEYWEAAHRRNTKPCPACGMPIDSDGIVCNDCAEEYDDQTLA